MSDKTPGAFRVGDMTWDRVAAKLAAGVLAVLPIGAGAKQHGWHLPMRADAIQAEWLAARLAEASPALVWPVLTYGHYPAFVDYAGSCSLSADLFEALVRQLLTSLVGHGARGVLVVDTGISTITPIDRAIAASPRPERILHLKVYHGPRYREAAVRLSRQVHGGHADDLETSLILALAPDLVDMARAAASPDEPPGPGPMQHADPTGANYSASGSIGDPTAATAGKGQVLLAAMVEDMRATIATWSGGDAAPR